MTSTAVVVCTWRGARGEILEEVESALTLGRKVGAALGAELHWLVVGEKGLAIEQVNAIEL